MSQYDIDNEKIIDKNSVNNISENDMLKQQKIIKNTSLIKDDITFTYPPYMLMTQPIRPILILDLNGILIYMCHLIDISDVDKCARMKNFLLIYKDFDMNLFVIYYRNYIKEFLLEINNYYDIYILSTLNRTLTDIFISTIIHLIGTNVFKGVYLKYSNDIKKNLEIFNHNKKSTVILDINETSWIEEHDRNIILINIFKGPHDKNYDKNNDLLIVKKCLLKIHKLFIDNNYGDIRNFIHECVLSS
jgi:hypothetical protein